MSEIAGRHILVTGGASGIGRLTAMKLAALGGRISVWDIHRENLDRVVAELGAAGHEPAHVYVCDVSKRENVYVVARETMAAGGPVDVVINNAGIVSGKGILEIPDEKIEATFAINTLSLFWTTKAFLPGMIERRRGHIVTIASASALVGVARLADYAASKWAAMGFDESLRAELRKTAPEVKTTVVCPYYMSVRATQDFTHKWPPISQNTFLYYNKGWREQNKLTHGHYDLKCDFDFVYGFSINPGWAARHDEARGFAMNNYWNAIDDIHLTLTKRDPGTGA
jgi:all-trans-retinol dehydrogenase (NAD+)